ncbi:MAG: type II secretion system F family protein [Candidatus Omnitrophica bacterium]|nr:type II secretion system F family protein [Candidatus Omnitrophota bacterium]
MKFFYKAKQGLDTIIEGAIEAASQEEAVSWLVKKNLFPLSVVPETDSPIAAPAGGAAASVRVDSRQILIFTQKLVTLARSQVELLRALEIISEHTVPLRFKRLVQDAAAEVKRGKPFSHALAKYPGVFSRLYVVLVRAGETGGSLATALQQLVAYLERRQQMRDKVAVALAYPALLSVVGMLSLYVLLAHVIPRLAVLFTGNQEALPAITRLVLSLSAAAQQYWWGAPLAVGGAAGMIFVLKGSPLVDQAWERLRLRIPVVGRLLHNQQREQFCRTLSLLLGNGVSLVNALEVALPLAGSSRLQEQLRRVRQEIISGASFSASLARTDLPKFVVQMVAVGEESGRLEHVMAEVGEHYAQEAETDIRLIAALLEPVLIFIMAVVLGGIVMAVLLPTLQISEMVR